MELNYKALSGHTCIMHARAALVDYIFRVQGAELRRLDFDAAASDLGVSRRTVSRYVGELAGQNVIVIAGDKLKLNDEFIIVG